MPASPLIAKSISAKDSSSQVPVSIDIHFRKFANYLTLNFAATKALEYANRHPPSYNKFKPPRGGNFLLLTKQVLPFSSRTEFD